MSAAFSFYLCLIETSMTIFRLFLHILLLLTLSAGAWAVPQAEIEAAYASTYKAAALKYRAGMMAHRAVDFKAYDLDGYPMNPTDEKAWLADFLGKAVSLRESGVVRNFRLLSQDEAECEVVDTIEAEVFSNTQKTQLQRVKLTTRSKDRWRWSERGWRQVSCRLLEQDYRVLPSGR